MESKDIIKALECCGYDEDMCLDCPIAKECESNELILEKKEEIFELIKNQQAEIERLKELVDEMSDYFPTCIDCDGKDNFGARTDKCVYLIDKTNFCAKRGIKNIASIQKENQSLKCELKIAKTEAYKEFTEKVNENRVNYFNYIYSDDGFANITNNIYKELTERKEK